MEITKLFFITFLSAFLGVIPPGLVNMTVAKTCLERGKKSGIFVAIGASVVVLFQALIAILLARYIFNNPYVRNILLRTGGVVFLLMAIYFFIKAKKKSPKVKTYKSAKTKSFFKGVMVSILNILPIPFFCAIGAALHVTYDALNISAFILAAALGTFTTLYFYVLSFLKIENKTAKFTRYSNYFMATLMLVLVIVTLARIYVTGSF
ncbi:LysE family translocator [Aquimarina rhabdastrellae]